MSFGYRPLPSARVAGFERVLNCSERHALHAANQLWTPRPLPAEQLAQLQQIRDAVGVSDKHWRLFMLAACGSTELEDLTALGLKHLMQGLWLLHSLRPK